MISLPTRTDLDVVLEFPSGYGLGYGHGKSCPILASTPGSDTAVAVTAERRRGNVESGAGDRLALQSTR